MIRVKYIGVDCFGRLTYKNIQYPHRKYVVVDGHFHTSSESGEPDMPFREGLNIEFDSPGPHFIRFNNDETLITFEYMGKICKEVFHPSPIDGFILTGIFSHVGIKYIIYLKDDETSVNPQCSIYQYITV